MDRIEARRVLEFNRKVSEADAEADGRWGVIQGARDALGLDGDWSGDAAAGLDECLQCENEHGEAGEPFCGNDCEHDWLVQLCDALVSGDVQHAQRMARERLAVRGGAG